MNLARGRRPLTTTPNPIDRSHVSALRFREPLQPLQFSGEYLYQREDRDLCQAVAPERRRDFCKHVFGREWPFDGLDFDKLDRMIRARRAL